MLLFEWNILSHYDGKTMWVTSKDGVAKCEG